MDRVDTQTGFIGIGSMGGMLVRSLLRSGALAATNVCVANRSQSKLETLKTEFPDIAVVDNKSVAKNCELIFICVGASDMASVLADLDSSLTSRQLWVITCSAVSLDQLERRVSCRVAKLIPSITQEIGAGIALLIYGTRTKPEDRTRLEKLFRHICEPVVIPESLARPAIGLTSGGPALIAYILQTMLDEAVASNPELSQEMAHQLLWQTASATIRLIAEPWNNPEKLIRRVAVPGGNTEAAISILAAHLPKAFQRVFRETAEREKKARATLIL